jgi:hypothetical protein
VRSVEPEALLASVRVAGPPDSNPGVQAIALRALLAVVEQRKPGSAAALHDKLLASAHATAVRVTEMPDAFASGAIMAALFESARLILDAIDGALEVNGGDDA